MSRVGRAVVCVPARDEAERLPSLLRSLAMQQGFAPSSPLGVVVVANNCTDDTAAIAFAIAAGSEAASLDLRLVEARFAPAEAHVGSARRLALDTGAAWLEAEGCPDGALLATDADAIVPPDWVHANLLALERADIVGGRLVIDAGGPPDPALVALHERIERYWSAVRALEDRLDPPEHDPSPRHGDHTGASLAFRAGLYRAVGGLPVLARGEDNAFVARVREWGGRLRHCPAVHVCVSDRNVGRAEGGMASEMTRRAMVVAGASPYRLPAAGHWQAAIARRADLRRIWREAGPGPALERALLGLGMTKDDIAGVAPETCRNDTAFVERACRHLARVDAEPSLVGIEAALAQFAALMRDERMLRGAA